MKLILKRTEGTRGPMLLFSEDGKPLPNQLRVDIDNQAGTVVVTFVLDGDSVKIKGDV